MTTSPAICCMVQGIVCVVVIVSSQQLNIAESNCHDRGRSLFCDGFIPDKISKDIRKIYIANFTDSHQRTLVLKSKSNGNWSQIEYLDIRCARPTNNDGRRLTFIQGETLEPFSHLYTLKISCQTLKLIERDTFASLNNLTELDLSGCEGLHLYHLTEAFRASNLASLKKLVLRRIGLFLSTILFFSKEFFESLQEKPIESLDLSGTKFGTMHLHGFATYLPYLQELNISRGGFLAINLISIFHNYGSEIQRMKKIDISYPTITDTFLDPSNKNYWETKFTVADNYVQNLTDIFVDGIVPTGSRARLYGVQKNSRLCVYLNVKPGNISLVTVCLPIVKGRVYLERLSVAHNGLEDIDLSLTSLAYYLQYVDLSYNNLHRMPVNKMDRYLEDAHNLFSFRGTHNQLSFIPFKMFFSTSKLEIIDLSHNQLESISFHVGHLQNLKVLRINHNKIHTLSYSTQKSLGGIFQTQNLMPSSEYSKISRLKVEMFGNPLSCSCEDKAFIEWIMNTEGIHVDNVCGITGNKDFIKEKVISKVEYDCRRPVIIAASTTATAVIFITIAILTIIYVRRLRKAKQKRHLMKLIKKYTVGKTGWKCPVFLSFSSADDEFVTEHVVEEMNKRLQSLLRTCEQCVATGDTIFRPGYYVLEEIVKCIEQCEVVVLCVSKSFCSSPWCKDEMLVSHYQHKPMLVMFLEEVRPTDMPKVLSTYLRNHSRSKWVKHGDNVKLLPSWDTVCQSIVDLMDDHSLPNISTHISDEP